MNNSDLTINDIRYILGEMIHKKKKYFILILIVGLIAGSSLNVILTIKNSKTSSQNSGQNNFESTKVSLGEKRAAQTESVYKMYTTFQNTLDEINSSSILSNKSESGVESTLTYYVDSKNNADSITNAVQSMFFTEQLTSEINMQLKTKIDESILKEYFDFNINSNNNNSSSNNNDGNGSTSNKIFTITIFAKNKSQLSVLSTCTTKQIDNVFKKLSKINSNTKYTLLDKSITKISERDMLSIKAALADDVTKISSSMMNLKNMLDTEQQSYFSELLSSNNSKQSEESSNAGKLQISYAKTFKFAILGAFVFEVAYLMILIIFFILSDRLHTPKELSTLNLSLLSHVKKPNDVNTTVNEICYYLQTSKERIVITSTLDIDGISDKMKTVANDCSLEIVNKYPKNKEDYEKLSTFDDIILFEKIGVSHKNEIKKMIDYYKSKDIIIDKIVLFD